jgi:succinate-semialdehyde dehydrogenase/glutarate-semialdehyde dehydrogenase
VGEVIVAETMQTAGETGSVLPLYHSWLNGKWVGTKDLVKVVDPGMAKPFALISLVDRESVKYALQVAHKAFPAWRELTVAERGAMLHAVADALVARKAEMATVITRENGKPLAQSEGEVMMSVDHLRWFAEEAKRACGRTIPNQVRGKRHLVVETPIGVVGAISPWNFPLVLAVRKIAPAMAAGCPVVLKPALNTPLSSVLLAECMQSAGVPAGVFQVLFGDAAMISNEMMSSTLCRKISFTGSTRVGRLLIEAAARTIKPLCLELGGLAPVLVFDDCDLDVAVRETVIAKFRNTGQSCIAANRIFVQRGVYDEFCKRFVAAVRALKTGYGLAGGMDVGPLISEAALNSGLRHIEDAVARGARVLTGGRRAPGLAGWFLEPTVLEGVAEDALCMHEETFAPVAPLSVFDTEEEAIERANRSEYGLSAYAMTRELARMFRLSERLEAGTLGINDGAPTVSSSPFGGVKQSGWGRELGSEGLKAFLETKHVSIGNIL